MSPDTDLRERLDSELDGLPSVPASTYLIQGRRRRRRRRTLRVAAAASAAAVVALTAVQVLAPGDSARVAQEGPTAPQVERPDAAETVDPIEGPEPIDPARLTDPDFVAPEPNNPVEAVEGLGSVDSFTTDEVPEWAQELDSNGPVALTADGRLWVAPGATVRRIVADPYPRGERGVTASYAVEADYPDAPYHSAGDIVWVVISTDGSGPGWGTMDDPGRWTDDFELWVDNETSADQGRPSFSDRLLRFADDSTSAVVPGARGVRIVTEQRDPDLGPDFVPHRRATVAEVSTGGERWWVVAVDPGDGGPWTMAFQGDRADDLDGFVQLLRGQWW